jgi:hypothetical protein
MNNIIGKHEWTKNGFCKFCQKHQTDFRQNDNCSGNRKQQAFAEPGAHNLIDIINPQTGLSSINGETLEQVRKRYPTAEVVDVDEWCQKKAEGQDSKIEWIETTEEKYYEMLGVLPPAWLTQDSFLVGEPYDHHAVSGAPRFAAYIHFGKRYLTSNRPMTIKEFKSIKAEDL